VPSSLNNTSNFLGSVSCTVTRCVIVGGVVGSTLMVQYALGHWSQNLATGPLSEPGRFLDGVSCAASFCAAVGGDNYQPLVATAMGR
jgi:hypothetical protein